MVSRIQNIYQKYLSKISKKISTGKYLPAEYPSTKTARGYDYGV
jgi:hypothetical protein